MSEWYVLNESGQKKGPYPIEEVRNRLRSGKIGLEDFVAIKGSPLFRQAISEDKIFHVYGVQYGKRKGGPGFVEQEGTRNSFLGLASPEAVGRQERKKRVPKPEVGKLVNRRDRDLKRPKKQDPRAALEVSGLKARQDKKIANRQAKKILKNVGVFALVICTLGGLIYLEQSGALKQSKVRRATQSAPRVEPKSFTPPSRLIPIKNVARMAGKNVRIGPLRYRSQGLRSCLRQKNKLAKCEIMVRGPEGDSVILSFFYQAWGKEILKRRENLYVSGLVLSDGKTVVLTELLGE